MGLFTVLNLRIVEFDFWVLRVNLPMPIVFLLFTYAYPVAGSKLTHSNFVELSFVLWKNATPVQLLVLVHVRVSLCEVE